jgi:hypothetical protein
VRIRRRKPCTRARRRLFGWNVRLPLATVNTPRVGGHRSAPEVCSMIRMSAQRTAVYTQKALAIDVQHTAATAPRGDCTRVLIPLRRVKLGPQSTCARHDVQITGPRRLAPSWADLGRHARDALTHPGTFREFVHTSGLLRRGRLTSVAGGLLKNRRSSPIHCHTLADSLYPQVCPHLWIIVWKDGRSGIFVGPTVPAPQSGFWDRTAFEPASVVRRITGFHLFTGDCPRAPGRGPQQTGPGRTLHGRRAECAGHRMA